MRHDIQPPTYRSYFDGMITQAWPYIYKIDPYKLKRAIERFLSYSQLEINFGEDLKYHILKYKIVLNFKNKL